MRNINLENRLALVDEFEMVSILFADIKGFTEYSNHVRNPRYVVELLRSLYTSFD